MQVLIRTLRALAFTRKLVNRFFPLAASSGLDFSLLLMG